MRGLHWKRSENAPTGGEDEFEVGTSRKYRHCSSAVGVRPEDICSQGVLFILTLAGLFPGQPLLPADLVLLKAYPARVERLIWVLRPMTLN